MRTGWNANGTYVRMKDGERDAPFKNGLRLTFDSLRYGNQAIMEKKTWSQGEDGSWTEAWERAEVHVQYHTDFTCTVDWKGAMNKWGEQEFNAVVGTTEPIKGLLEANFHYWQRVSQD